MFEKKYLNSSKRTLKLILLNWKTKLSIEKYLRRFYLILFSNINCKFNLRLKAKNVEFIDGFVKKLVLLKKLINFPSCKIIQIEFNDKLNF